MVTEHGIFFERSLVICWFGIKSTIFIFVFQIVVSVSVLFIFFRFIETHSAASNLTHYSFQFTQFSWAAAVRKIINGIHTKYAFEINPHTHRDTQTLKAAHGSRHFVVKR